MVKQLQQNLSKIKYYLENDEERIKIANEGYKHWKETCSADVFWPKLFEIAGVK